ncbi:MAG: shikimate kinase [bacterium]
MINLHNIFGVTGNPILHSKSPYIFNYLNNKPNLFDTEYIRVATDSASEIIDLIKELGIKGLNITSPFKHDIIQFLDEIVEPANIISAVNVVINQNNKLFGYNTDYHGVIDTIKYNGLHNKNYKFLVIGSGGAGRAAAYGLIREGQDVTLINRTKEKSKLFADKINCKYADWSHLKKEIDNSDICINTLPSKYLNLNQYFHEGQYVLNADYTVVPNDFQYRQINALEWLVNQAIPTFKIFAKSHPEHVEGYNATFDMKEYKKLLNTLMNQDTGVKHKPNIALIGFIGSGKTTIGKLLSEKLNWEFVDTDELIVQKEQIPIREIFRIHGEQYFRNLEKEVLLSMKDKKNVVISCGGGLILDDDNRDILKNISNIFWLFSTIEKCMDRLNSDLRPPLTNPFDSTINPVEKAEILFNYRIPYYCEVADALIFNNSSITQAVNKIYEEVHTYFGY